MKIAFLPRRFITSYLRDLVGIYECANDEAEVTL